jgi:hypothetical membrane protein
MRLFGSLYAAVYVLMVLVAFILPFFSSESYSITQNSLSELGAQTTPGNWIMNAVFILLAIATILLGTKALKRFWFPLYLLYFFALALGLTAIYKHAPIEDVLFWRREHLLHSIFSLLTGISFSVYCIVISFFIVKKVERASAILMCCLATALSLFIFQFPEYRGVFQRLLFITAFGWLFYSLVTFKFEKMSKKQLR